jgi:hypothetical protein
MNCKELADIYKINCENIENNNMKYCTRILKIYFAHCNNINDKNNIYTKNDIRNNIKNDNNQQRIYYKEY